jgi:antitoxin component YwqK of YwqJK toxin-antitoxin module
MMPRKLDDGTDARKWNGTLTEFHKDGSKRTETVYKNGDVAVRMEWDETGNLIKEEASPGYKSSNADADEQNVQMSEVKDLKLEYPWSNLNFRRKGVTDTPLLYAKGENEPFTGVAFSNHSNGKRSTECSILNGKKLVRLKWDKDGNLIEKETLPR